MNPKMSRSEKIAKTKADKRISAAYYSGCDRVQINMMDIPKVFNVGHQLIAGGADDVALKAGIMAFVETIRKN